MYFKPIFWEEECFASSSLRPGLCDCSEAQQRLVQLEDAAKSAGLGKWGSSPPTDHVRDTKWTVEDPRKLVDSKHSKPVKGQQKITYGFLSLSV